jgi:acyl-CoA thioester hydrolase
MYESSTQIRVHYALTDQMGVVYHGHYAQFFEIGRAEAIRQLGFTYKELEAMGIIMPVVDFHARFLAPVKYDELITVKITLRELPIHHKVIFYCDVYTETGTLATSGTVTLYFMEAATMKRSEMPAALREKLEPYFN